MKTRLEEKQKNIWISTTGYRIFLELKALLQSPKTLDELLETIKKDSLLGKEVSKDTVRFDINTLRSAGFEITRPAKSNDFKYQIVYNPFSLNISSDELAILLELRENLSAEISLNEVFILNDLYEKIFSLTENEEQRKIVYNSKVLSDIDKNIFKEISNPKFIGKKVQIKYKSPKNGEENTDIIPLKILYENKKAYILAYNFKYNANSFFELSKVLKINYVSINTDYTPIQTYEVVYKVFGEMYNIFEPKSYETIIERKENEITVKAVIESEFMFIQRLLLLGRDFKIISPDIFREKLVNEIKMVQKRYFNGQNR